jgi:hypothetical protein
MRTKTKPRTDSGSERGNFYCNLQSLTFCKDTTYTQKKQRFKPDPPFRGTLSVSRNGGRHE